MRTEVVAEGEVKPLKGVPAIELEMRHTKEIVEDVVDEEEEASSQETMPLHTLRRRPKTRLKINSICYSEAVAQKKKQRSKLKLTLL